MENIIPVVPIEGDVSIYAENLSQCLKTTYQFSGRAIHNICDGTQYFIPNGFWDYALWFTLVVFGICIILALLRMAID